MTAPRGWLGRLAATVALLLGGAGHALDLTVDPSGGPLTLEEHVEAALADWRAAGVDPDAVAVTATVRYGDPARFGPDVEAWVVLRGGADGDQRTFDVLVSPTASSPRAALIPALGVVLGGSLGGDGALDPILDPTGPRQPTEADGEALEARRTAVPGDLNRDGRVDFEDLLLLAAAFGERGVNLPADLDADGTVDDDDLDVLRESYEFGRPAEAEGD